MHAHKHCKKTKYIQSAWVTTVSDLFVFYSVQFYEHIEDTKKALKSKTFPDILYKWTDIPTTLCCIMTF